MSTLYPLAVQKTFAKKSVQLINNLISRYCASKKCETHHLFGQLQKHTFFTYPRQFLRSRAPWVGHVCASLLNCEWNQLQSKGMPAVHGMEWQHSSTSPRRWEDESQGRRCERWQSHRFASILDIDEMAWILMEFRKTRNTIVDTSCPMGMTSVSSFDSRVL